MKPKRIIFGLFSLSIILICSCQKENDTLENIINQNGAKIKRILLYTSIESKDPISIVEEYEYDGEDRVSKVSSPMYHDGEIVGTIKYDLYEYNSQGQLIKIKNFNANTNSPTGYINLKNYIYTYSDVGKKEKEKIEYPQIGSSEYSLYKYNRDKLTRIDKYDRSDNLESYVVNDYDNSGNLIRMTSFGKDNQPFSYTQNTYKKGLIVKSDVFAGKDMKEHVHEILRTYDENNNLIILESNELSLYSSMMSYVFNYEYFEE
jgi:hypothetical protein